MEEEVLRRRRQRTRTTEREREVGGEVAVIPLLLGLAENHDTLAKQ
jgi:hypothetical protein